MNQKDTTEMTGDPRACKNCGAPVPGDAPSKMCPSCLAGQVMFSQQNTLGGSAGFVPPTSEELQRLIPQMEIKELIGAGGMGAVYKGEQTSLKRQVAIKLLPLELTEGDPAFTERFMREAQTMAKLNHPNIVTIYDFGETSEGHCYIVMEYVEGSDLHQMIHSGGVSPKQALVLIPQVCEGLQYAHDEGIVHRDIKPANILVDARGRVKLTDFGLAKLFGQDNSQYGLTMTGTAMGTPDYAAPEQIRPNGAIDHRVDIYSLGVVLYELLTGQVPRGIFEPPSKKKLEIDVRLDEVVIRAMQAEREQRYQQVSEVKTKVEEIGESKAGKKPVSLSKGNQSRRPLWLGAAAIVVLMCIVIWKWGDENQDAPAPVVEEEKTDLAPGDLVAIDPARAAKLIVEARILTEAGEFERAQEKLRLANRCSGDEDAGLKADLVVAFHAVRSYMDAREVADEFSRLANADHERFQEIARLRISLDERFRKVDLLFDAAAKMKEDGNDQGECGSCDEILKLVPGHPEAVKLLAVNPVHIKRQLDVVLARLEEEFSANAQWQTPVVDVKRGEVKVALRGIGSVALLEGIFITDLDVASSKSLKSISALEGMPLHSLNISDTGVSDISPLRGMRLRKLNLSHCPVTDLSAMQEIQVSDELLLGGIPASDFRPLLGKEIKKSLFDCAEPLAGVGESFLGRSGDIAGEAEQVRASYGSLNNTNLMKLADLFESLADWRRSGAQTPPQHGFEVEGRQFALVPAHLTQAGAKEFAAGCGPGVGLARLDDDMLLKVSQEARAMGFGEGGLRVRIAPPLGEDDASYYVGCNEGVRGKISADSRLPVLLEWVNPMPGLAHVNSLGMRFLPVKAEGMERTLVSVYETQARDYQLFMQETGRKLEPAPKTGKHPVLVRWDDATEFGVWLTRRERAAGRLRPGECYRLPLQSEWLATAKASLGQWPPEKLDSTKANLHGGQDGYASYAPVGSFPPAETGFYDLIGNASEWTFDKEEMQDHVSYRRVVFGANCHQNNLRLVWDSLWNTRTGFRLVISLKREEDVKLATEVEERLRRLAEENTVEKFDPYYWVREGKVFLKSNDAANGQRIKKIGALRGLPIVDLDLVASQVEDLDPLAGMPLTHLNIGYMPVSDLKPLAGMPLKSLSLFNSWKIKDLSPLAGMPLEHLNLGYFRGDVDLSPLVGLPLRRLHLSHFRINNLEPLKKMPDVKFIGLNGRDALHGSLRHLTAGNLQAAAKSFQRFEQHFANFEPFKHHVRDAAQLREICSWAVDGKKGPPPGAIKFGNSHYLGIKHLWLDYPENKLLVKRLGGHLPTFSDQQEQDWFRKHIQGKAWLALGPDTKGGWKWTTGEALSYQAEWLKPQDVNSKSVMLDKGKWVQIHPEHGAGLAIEWSNIMPGVEHENSLGMRFLPVKAEGMERTLVSACETRVKEFRRFVRETGYDAGEIWKEPALAKSDNHPVAGIDWVAAERFCQWLTQKERKLGHLRPGECYRLPTHAEWLATVKASCGGKWPPENVDLTKTNLSGKDGFPQHAAPVASFPAAENGFFDLIGNVREWLGGYDTLYRHQFGTMGGSWRSSVNDGTFRYFHPRKRMHDTGFRVVLSLKTEADVELAKQVEERLQQLAVDNPLPEGLSWDAMPLRYRVSDGKVIFRTLGDWVKVGNKEYLQHIKDLTSLAGLPVARLYLYDTKVLDLTPLKAMPLEALMLWPDHNNTRALDLSPLEGAPLRAMEANIGLKSLRPLMKSQLQYIKLYGQAGNGLDFSPLVKLPLKRVDLPHTHPRDLSPLLLIPDLEIHGLNSYVVLREPMRRIMAGDHQKAVELLTAFEQKFSGSKVFEPYVKTGVKLRKLSQWVLDGKKGVPPGALTYGGNHYFSLAEMRLACGDSSRLAKGLGGHLPVFTTPEEHSWFNQNITDTTWLGLRRDDDGKLKWVTGEALKFQAEWMKPIAPESPCVLQKSGKWVHAPDAMHSPLCIEWEGK